ncbi:MAG: DUF6682 family protein [Pseudomonadota bacterium]
MGTITTASIIASAATLLQDETNIRWPQAELLKWLNDGQREIVSYKPNTSVRNVAVQLVAGTKQTLPADGISLIDIVRNMGSNGATPGRSVRIVMREILDAQIPDWHTATAAAAAKHYIYSLLDQKTFYVYPPQPSSAQGYVELVYSAAPTDALLSGAITVDDIYQTVLLDYILFRAYGKDIEYAADVARSQSYQQSYLATLTGKAKGEAAINPNANAPANPNSMKQR